MKRALDVTAAAFGLAAAPAAPARLALAIRVTRRDPRCSASAVRAAATASS